MFFKRFMSDGFRFFFLAAGLYGVFSVLVWTGWLAVHAAGGMLVNEPFAMPAYLWHAHEMIFGFPAAALGGFFLTAVPNWTGAKPAAPGVLSGLALLWIVGRLGVWFSSDLAPVLVAVLDLCFMPTLGFVVGLQLFKNPKPRNLMFLGLIAIVWSGDLLVHLEWTYLTEDTLWSGLHAGLLGTCAMIAILGGRVTPAFTRNAMMRDGYTFSLPLNRPVLDKLGIVFALLAPLAFLFTVADEIRGIVLLSAGFWQFLRLSGWRGGWTLSQPILWALHSAYFMLSMGYVLMGLSAFGWGGEIAALHFLGIGAVGGMTLAVMSRAALGHSGRPLVAPRAVAIAYALVPVAAVLRWLASELDMTWYYPGIFGAGAIWMLAFSLYVIALWPAFTGPRADAIAGEPS